MKIGRKAFKLLTLFPNILLYSPGVTITELQRRGGGLNEEQFEAVSDKIMTPFIKDVCDSVRFIFLFFEVSRAMQTNPCDGAPRTSR